MRGPKSNTPTSPQLLQSNISYTLRAYYNHVHSRSMVIRWLLSLKMASSIMYATRPRIWREW